MGKKKEKKTLKRKKAYFKEQISFFNWQCFISQQHEEISRLDFLWKLQVKYDNC